MTTIRPELKRIHSPDIFDLETPGLPEDQPFCVLVQTMFGPEGVDGEESFDMLVCNPLWVADQSKRGAFSGRHHLIVGSFDIRAIRSFWEDVAKECSGATWEEVAEQLGRYGKWEFEDYVE
ncbi:Imm8 family immunity protein [Methylosinus sp. Sm6]|uniref:Imm8 family immunity protein n=1 Tax=Methylosinus sp. Sm6 TaxID=2866948 RepID=UPI001C99687E|nr:Imm8 family immunity protein [Methylosinus sp. Sm6]MBY6240454.1 immunity 8 family protein [Methylosinus sp. Sm6]